MAVLEVVVLPDPEAVAARAATMVAERARAAVGAHGRFAFAVSGGRTPWQMFRVLSREDFPWAGTAIFQVDERIAPEGDPDRNLTYLMESLPGAGPEVHGMPVEEDDLEGAAARYARTLPERFDLVHLGLGDDGHTASLVPGDPVLDVVDRDVAVTREYRGRRRMTLTFRALDRAEEVLWLVTGPNKAEPLRMLRERDPSIPAGRVAARRQVVLADRAAAASRV